MIKYYAYYNHGGYKDFFLGSQTDLEEVKYFLPLLNIHKQALRDNSSPELLQSVKRQNELPKIIVLTDKTTEYNYPKSARILMSHSGYKILYKKLDHNSCVLSVRDILGKKDTYDRVSPFNFMFIGDTPEDIPTLDLLAEYIRQNLSSFENFINSVFENDMVENGLKFNLGSLNSYVSNIIKSDGIYPYDENVVKTVRLLVISRLSNFKTAIAEQKISKNEIDTCYDINGNVIYKSTIEQSPEYIQEQTVLQHDTKHRQQEHTSPSIHQMLNVPKLDEIEDIWEHVHKLEKRVEDLERTILNSDNL